MKILLATPLYPPEIGGPATHAEILVRAFPKEGIEVVLLPFSRVRSLPKIVRHVAYLFLALRHARGVDAVYALDPVSVGVPAFLAAKLLGKRFILRVPGDYAWEQGQQRFGVTKMLDAFVLAHDLPLKVRILQKIQSYVARSAETVIVPSTYLGGIVRAWGVHAEHVVTVYSSVTVPGLPPKAEARARVGIRAPYVLTAGRLVPWKGFEALIRSVENSSTKPQLGIAGDGPDHAKLEGLIAERHMQSEARLLGSLTHKDLMLHIAAADVFVLNTGYEGLSHQLIEVMLAGVPIITTPVGGNAELITDRKSGLLVPYNDEEKIASAIDTILGNPEGAAALAAAAKEHAAAFTEERMIATLVPVFKTSHP